MNADQLSMKNSLPIPISKANPITEIRIQSVLEASISEEALIWCIVKHRQGNLTPPPKIHKNAPLNNHKNRRKIRKKNFDPIFGSSGRFLGKFLAQFQKSLNFEQIIVEKCLTLEMKAFNKYFHIKEK